MRHTDAADAGDRSAQSAPDDGVGQGQSLSPVDERWRAASAELAPEKFLVRVTANARATVTTVALVGTLLTGLGLVSAQTVPGDGRARWLALTAAGAALVSVLLGLLYLAQRIHDVNVEDLAEIERWYTKQFRRAYLAVCASWALVVAVLFAGFAAALNIFETHRGDDAALGLRVSGTGENRRVEAEVVVSGLAGGSIVTVRVIGVAGTCPDVVLLESTNRADRTGNVIMNGAIDTVSCTRRFRLELHGDELDDSFITVP